MRRFLRSKLGSFKTTSATLWGTEVKPRQLLYAVVGLLIAGMALGALSVVAVDKASLEPAVDVQPAVTAHSDVDLDPGTDHNHTGGIVWPVTGEVITPFGWMYSPVYRGWKHHAGIDIAAEPREAVVAMASGLVISVNEGGSNTFSVTIDHGKFGKAVYGNLDNVAVKSGFVDVGSIIGYVADNTLCLDDCGHHIHIEIRRESEPVDPMVYLPH